MSTHLAKTEMAEAGVVRSTRPAAPPRGETIEGEEAAPLNAARGIIIAAIISSPVWILIAYLLYLVL